MSRIRVVIVDDEPIARRGIRQLLAAHGDVEIAGEARNGNEAVRLIDPLAPDLVFLDVQMPELDGFEVLRRLDAGRLPAVIFVTAYDTFAVRAFELHALDYLVKPLHEQRFHAALARARERLRSKEAMELAQQLSRLLASVPGGDAPALPEPARRLVFATSGGDLILDVAEIDWIEADDYYAAVRAAAAGTCFASHLPPSNHDWTVLGSSGCTDLPSSTSPACARSAPSRLAIPSSSCATGPSFR